MRPCLALDPTLLALSQIATDETQLASAISVIISIAQRMREKSDCNFYTLADTDSILAMAGFYPVPASIAAMLKEFDLVHVYTVEDIRRAIMDILSRAQHLEELSRIDFMIPTSFVATPDVGQSTAEALRDALQLTMLHVAMASLDLGNLVQIIVGGCLKAQRIEIAADVDDIDPPLERDDLTKIDGFESSIWSIATIDQFLFDLPPDLVWRHATDGAEIALAVRLAAYKVRVAGGCSDPKNNCDRFVVGSFSSTH
jgi:hypothetical protein